MRKNINTGWLFTKNGMAAAEGAAIVGTKEWEPVDLPHTWNGVDGQDGGNDFYRGTCWYAKVLSAEESAGEVVYLEFEGANSSADVYVNGSHAAHHDGGYSTFRVNVTELLKKEEENLVMVAVDNSPNEEVYPQMADFTFYGGLYRSVNLITVSKTHFDLDRLGGPAIRVTPVMRGADADVTVKMATVGGTGAEKLLCRIMDAEKNVLQEMSIWVESGRRVTRADFVIEEAHLWNGRKDPYLYTAEAFLMKGDEIIDSRIVRFGCRTFRIDPENGFFLNGKSYPLRGVSRHQDRPGIGNALTYEHHKEDMDLICEMGANTIRLAHYQHSQDFYDLCDERGMVVWAEIPYISRHMPDGRANTISQMKELIAQNYNHPSIVVWGLSNEITMGGDSDPDLLENHRILNKLVHKMDKTRLTTMAVVSMCPTNSPYLEIPDVLSWNHYFGWYGGNTDMNGPWFDKFHEEHPNTPVGVSEYGCEALNWHTSDPQQGDYTEEYQAFYHEELIRQLFSRKYLWATHVWNMFDFAADSRSEGGEDGMNHKGLVTFDRKYRKDSFYAYKAWLSDEPFVHICGKRYVNRVEDVTKVTIYSNLPEVELFANGVSIGRKTSEDHFFYFYVENEGTTQLMAIAGDCSDESTLVKVEEFDDSYVMKETGDIINWFEITTPEGYLSINDKISEIKKHPMAILQVALFVKKLVPKKSSDAKAAGEKPSSVKKEKVSANDVSANDVSANEVSPNKKTRKKSGGMNVMAMLSNKSIWEMMGGFTVKRMISMMRTAGLKVPEKEDVLKLNEQLNKIRK